jgi:hypothetical protein
MKGLRHALCGALLLVVLASPNLVTGCGPFIDEALFAFTTRPDPPLENFLSGRLGILQPTYRSRFLFAAYRQLAGVPLDKDEQVSVLALDRFMNSYGQDDVAASRAEAAATGPVAMWTQARAKVVPGEQPNINPTVTRDYATWTNCQDDAFRTAARTLDDRIGKYRAASPDVREWVLGQDAVFANCGQNADAVPHATNAGAPAWLRADREYQIAAAKFYAGHYDAAAEQFRRIAADHNSPWSTMGPYLAARCLIRKAMKNVLDREAGEPDKAALGQAETALKSIMANPAQQTMRGTAESLLGFVEFRLHPEQRAEELASTLSKPHGGDNFRQHLRDYTLLLDQTEPDDDMSDWIRTLSREGTWHRDQQAGVAVAGTNHVPKPGHALEKWRATKSLPWLVAALMLEPAGSPAAEELRAAALKAPANSPAFLTLQYHAVRLAGEAGQLAARKELDALAHAAMTPSAANLFQMQRARRAATFAAFLSEIQIKPVGTIDGATGAETTDVPNEGGGIFFDTYGAEALNKRTPLSLMQQAVRNASLAAPLRRKLALAAWTRAVLLDDAAAGDALSQIVSEVEPSLAGDMREYRAAAGAAKPFAGTWIVLRHPGLRPYVTPGLESRPAAPAERDPFRDNWWCGDVGAHAAAETHANPSDCAPTFDCPDADPDPNFLFLHGRAKRNARRRNGNGRRCGEWEPRRIFWARRRWRGRRRTPTIRGRRRCWHKS